MQARTRLLLSFLYALLTGDVASACESVGLDPQMGFLHGVDRQRPALVGARPDGRIPSHDRRPPRPLVGQPPTGQRAGLHKAGDGRRVMDTATRKTVLVAYQKRKDEEIFPSFLEGRS